MRWWNMCVCQYVPACSLFWCGRDHGTACDSTRIRVVTITCCALCVRNMWPHTSTLTAAGAIPFFRVFPYLCSIAPTLTGCFQDSCVCAANSATCTASAECCSANCVNAYTSFNTFPFPAADICKCVWRELCQLESGCCSVFTQPANPVLTPGGFVFVHVGL